MKIKIGLVPHSETFIEASTTRISVVQRMDKSVFLRLILKNKEESKKLQEFVKFHGGKASKSETSPEKVKVDVSYPLWYEITD